jgi:hypothetical protein
MEEQPKNEPFSKIALDALRKPLRTTSVTKAAVWSKP